MYAAANPRAPHAPAYGYGYGYPQHNPLSRGAKIAIGVATVLGVGTAAFLLWPGTASAKPPGPAPGPTPPAQPPRPKRPPGDPPPFGRSCFPVEFGGQARYDESFWDAGGRAVARQRIFDVFEDFGYQTPAGRDTMNDPGPDAALGGGDDVPNAEVSRFQREYNAVSRWGGFLSNMGGLDVDGFVGPCTLNGLKVLLDNVGEDDWQSFVSQARSAGFRP